MTLLAAEGVRKLVMVRRSFLKKSSNDVDIEFCHRHNVDSAEGLLLGILVQDI